MVGGGAASRARPPTIEEVAALAGVGRGTASRALSGAGAVSDAKRQAVLRAAEQLQYRPNRAAQSLRTRRSGAVALVVPEAEELVFGDTFFAGIIRGVSDEVAAAGLHLVLVMPRDDGDRLRLEQQATDGHVDGVLLISAHDADPLLGSLLAAGVPVVSAGRTVAADVCSVDADNRGGAEAATRHLLAAGRQRVATVCGPLDMSAGRDRQQGWADALTRAGLGPDEALVARGDFTEASGEAGAAELLARCSDLDALFVASDLMAAGALRALHGAGRRVPDDVAVVGFDDRPLARHLAPPLTTVSQPIEEIGRRMTGLLVALLRDQEPAERHVTLPTRLVVRASA